MIGGSVPKLLEASGRMKEALDKIGKPLPGGVTVKNLAAKTDDVNKAVAKADALKAELRKLVNQKKEACKELSAYIVKSRLAVKVEFGADSSEYEMAGGVRASERKKPVRKPKA